MNFFKKNCALVFGLFLCAFIFSQDYTSAKSQAKIQREKFVDFTKKYVGFPYEYGANPDDTDPKSFDCSGLVYFCSRNSIGVQLPRTAKAMYNYCKIVPARDREAGDLVFFKTSGNDISHVGIYIGRNQFISAISDGPNTGVIVSSLDSDYWKPKYVASGQFLRATKEPEYAYANSTGSKSDVIEEIEISLDDEDEYSKAGFWSDFIVDGAVYGDWALINPNSFMISFRGVDVILNARKNKWVLSPGIGFNFRFNSALGMFQIPVLISSNINDFIRVYAGPVISFGKGTLPESETKILSSVFPGIIGVSFSTPAIKAWKTRIQLVQDINYTVYNNLDNSALSLKNSVACGLVMYTGIRVTVPAGAFF